MSTEGAFQPSLFDDLTPDDADTGTTGPVVPVAGPDESTEGSDRSSSDPLVLPAGGEPAHAGGVRVGGWAAEPSGPTSPTDEITLGDLPNTKRDRDQERVVLTDGDNPDALTAGRSSSGRSDNDPAPVPYFIAERNHAEYRAGWRAGRRAAAAGPLPDEIAADVLRIMSGSETRDDLHPLVNGRRAGGGVDADDCPGQ